MNNRYGILLIDKTEIIFRIYEVSNTEWKLLYYHGTQLRTSDPSRKIEVAEIAETIAAFLITEQAQHIAEWRGCVRGLSTKMTREIADATGMSIENLTLLREQELLCKGIFTELW